ncbi:MAG: hypothetical protein QOD70_1069, partial [Frankiales bacterium]|nr:hypothetical protein [Frankiales bacterium]
MTVAYLDARTVVDLRAAEQAVTD